MASLELKNITKTFGTKSKIITAVNNVTIRVEEGELLALVGPSGCGKTTTLRIIGGLEKANNGEVWMDEKQVDKHRSDERNIAICFQHHALYKHLSVKQNIEMGAKIKGISNIEEKLKSICQLLQIEKIWLERSPQELSGGQQQRIALARALIRDPKIVLLDEPLSALDAKLRAETRVEIKRWHLKEPRTTVIVTHDQIEALTLATKLGVMRNGKIEQLDNPQEVYTKPKNRFVAEFIGNPKINIWDGEESNGTLTIPNIGEWTTGGNSGKIKVGIRPNEINYEKGKGTWTCELCEYTGKGTVITGRKGTETITIESKDTWKTGENFEINPNITAIHKFNAITEDRIF